MKIALVSTGLGRVLRGFESFTESLFGALRAQVPDLRVTLFQGGGRNSCHRITVPNLHRYDAPAAWLGYDKANLLEKRSFALSLYPLLRLGRYDIVHYNEVAMGSALWHLRRYLGGKFRLLYCDGGGAWPVHYRQRCDFAQLLTGPAYEWAFESGIPSERLFLLPYGVNANLFGAGIRASRIRIRRELGIPDDAKVVLSVAALEFESKRVNHLIREVANLNSQVWLVVAGQRTAETEVLEGMAQNLLGDRWRFVSWPHARIPMLYGAADVFTLTSLVESFGLVIIEAAMSGLPVITHHGRNFRWLAEDSPIRCIDMDENGQLTRELELVLSQPSLPSARDIAVRRFSWQSLAPEYLRMYELISAGGVKETGGRPARWAQDLG
jgi:glycosyltransferase involved in cell wall biosynthesis